MTVFAPKKSRREEFEELSGDVLGESTEATVERLLAAVDARDHYTAVHSRGVVELAASVARRMRLSADQAVEVEQVALLHDIGKIEIPDAVLQKAGPLNQDEWTVMRKHPEVGARIVGSIRSLAHLSEPIRAEHERWDGRGYPDGLAGEEIPLASRIVFACDAFHAMTSDRPYRKAMPRHRALEELRANAGSQFCPSAVEALCEAVREGERGRVVTRPARSTRRILSVRIRRASPAAR